MPRNIRALVALMAAFFALSCLDASGQVLAPDEIKDPAIRSLQEKYRPELKAIAEAIRNHQFPYNFYLSRKLDLTEAQQKSSDQRSIQFDSYDGQVVLKITGNYYAAYSHTLMSENQRARATYQNVMLPILLDAIPRFRNTGLPQAFALEISHHVRRKVLGVPDEQPENVVLILPMAAAERLVAATNDAERRSAALDGEAFLNTKPIQLFPEGERLLAVRNDKGFSSEATQSTSAFAAVTGLKPANEKAAVAPAVGTSMQMPAGAPAAPAMAQSASAQPVVDFSPQALKALDASHHGDIAKMLKEQESQTHFVAYAPPAFIAFRDGAYLQLSITTTLDNSAGASQYRLAALAFDRHIAHLIRPILAYFKDCPDFSGIDFSTSIRTAGGGADGDSMAVEYIFSLGDLHKYQNFDLTGQDLIRGGYILVNGERISLELQEAEGNR